MPRAIALKGVRPSPEFTPKEPGKTYRLHDVVGELLAQGWELVPNKRMKLGHFWDRPRPGDPVVAEYRRKCGASRRIAIPHPPDPYLRFPVYDLNGLFKDGDVEEAMRRMATVSATTLTFRFVGYERQVDQFGEGPYIAVYEEQ